MEPPVVVSGTVTPQELSRFLREEEHCASPPRILPMVLWVVALPGYAFVFISLAAHGFEAMGREVFWLGVLLAAPVYLEKVYRKTVTSVGAARDRIGASRKLGSPSTYRFFGDRMERETLSVVTTTPWSDVESVVELGVGFVVRARSGDEDYLPRRFFGSELELEAFRLIVRDALGKGFQLCPAAF